MTSSVGINRIGRFDYKTKRDEDHDAYYVSRLMFRNAGKTIFGDTPWWQEIKFDSPESIDDLIDALTYARMMARHPGTYPDSDYENVVTATFRANNEFAAKKVDGGWECTSCHEVVTTKYDPPKICPSCGVFFDEYKEQEVTDE